MPALHLRDAQIGRLLDTLDRLNLWDDTIVVLTADHGYHLWEQDWWGKCTSYELSARVPLIVWAPVVVAPGWEAVLKGLSNLWISIPALRSYAGCNLQADWKAQAFTSLLNNPSGAGKEAAYTETIGEDLNHLLHNGKRKRGEGRNSYSVRTTRWRYTRWSDGRAELYDHSSDTGEYYNLAQDAQYRDVCAKLKSMLLKTNTSTANVT